MNEAGHGPGSPRPWRARWREAQHRKKVERILQDAPRADRMLTRRHLVLLGLAVVIGAGGYRLGPFITGAGLSATAVGLVLSTVAAVGAAMCFAELSSTLPVGGSAYTYSYAAFGLFTAWTVGGLLLLEYAAGAGVVTFGWAQFVVGWVDVVTRAQPSASVTRTIVEAVAGVLLIVLVTAGLYHLDRFRRTAIRLTAASVVWKLVFLVAAMVAGVWIVVAGVEVQPDTTLPTFRPAFPPTGGLEAFGLLYFAFIGFDAVGTAADDSRYPPRDLPRATLATVAVGGLIYLALLGVAALGIGNGVGNPVAGEHVGILLRIGATIGLPSGVAVLVYALSRIFVAVGRDGAPAPAPGRRELAGPEQESRLVRRAVVLAGVLTLGFFAATAGLSVVDRYREVVTEITNLATASAFAVVAVGTVALRYRRPDLPRTFRAPMLPLVSVLTVVASLVLFWINAYTTVVALLAWLVLVVLGLVVQVWLSASRGAAGHRTTAGPAGDPR